MVQYPLKPLQKASIPSWIHEKSPFIGMRKKGLFQQTLSAAAKENNVPGQKSCSQ